MGHLELAVLGLACCLAVVSAATLGVVPTEGGFVEGVNKKLGLFGIGGRSVDIFKGIPFAAPPKVLEKPQPHPGWQGTLKAKDFKQECLQAPLIPLNTKGSEDCLYLNIWVPQGQKEVSQNLPVMIWIYGGGFYSGSAEEKSFFNQYLHDGEEIATRGNVIVVTFNYRLGALGFLSTGDANLPGNYGLWDQHMAIAWVKRNIAAFGGDPGNITIFGQSAGGASVSLQVLSPYNKGLIRRAISQSGSAVASWAIQRDPLRWAKQIAKKVGCPQDDTARMAKCLKATEPRALALAHKINPFGMASDVVVLVPVIDGDFIPDEPINLFANTADIDYIAGTNNMDAHFLVRLFVPAVDIDLLTITGSARTYTYLFSKPSRKPFYPSWVGADHAEDVPYVFGRPFATPLSYRAQDRTVSQAMIAYWTNFARTGDPNQGHMAVPTQWEPYTQENGNYLEINNKMDGQSMKQHLRSSYLQYWTQTYQALPTVNEDEAGPVPALDDAEAVP
ncbi:bile salt-activated lipase-like isoform X2 [Myotis daubentonii]|uniref:bile salt-activated lipase-like isoform X2 n=1 Tax=Myotis daubentonii TaxID=98922 RepID=UPI0028731C5A|nr:bile salt-activated lipase-like isoform X2 [Myotis daubentonii]